MPFHVVRTRLLGNIASPDMTASPTDTVAGLWGGELPAINDLDALNELLRVLLMGLWNRLARHQNRNAPFRMIHVDAPETREGLANIAAIRREEVIGFIEGMFGKEQGLALPEQARRALEALAGRTPHTGANPAPGSSLTRLRLPTYPDACPAKFPPMPSEQHPSSQASAFCAEPACCKVGQLGPRFAELPVERG
jgi:hypothetical protein